MRIVRHVFLVQILCLLSSLSAMAQAPAAKPAAQSSPPPQPAVLGEFNDWQAYITGTGPQKLCYALSKPVKSETNPPNRPRDAIHMFISTRPAENIRNEISIIVGYRLKEGGDVSVDIGDVKFTLYTKDDGAWLRSAAEEAKMVETMRKGKDLVVKGVSGRGTQTTDVFSLKGVSGALDKIAQECK